MKGQQKHSFLSVCLIFSLNNAFALATKSMKGAYYPSWASSSLSPSSIETTLFTHIYYAFLSPSSATFRFEVDNSTAVFLADFTSTLRAKRPPVKTLYSIGGGGDEGSDLFSRMASTTATRGSFIRSSIEVARRLGFDGMDLDWEFPQNPKEMEDYALLLKEWRREVQREAWASRRPPLLLSAAVYFSHDFFLAANYRSYPAGSIGENLDWVNIMCYDYHGAWDTSATGAPAALFDPRSNISTSYGMGKWIKAGVPRSKLVMGLPLYGRTWTLKDPKVHGVGAPAIDVGPGQGGVLLYSKIEEFNKQNNATIVFDFKTVSTYSMAGISWIGYDDTRSTSLKVAYAQALGLRGYFFWALSYDQDWKISRAASHSWRRR